MIFLGEPGIITMQIGVDRSVVGIRLHAAVTSRYSGTGDNKTAGLLGVEPHPCQVYFTKRVMQSSTRDGGRDSMII